MKRVAVIGAGVSGLACAFRLEELRKEHSLPLEVTVYEAAPRTGGTIGTEEKDGFVLEKGPDSFLSEKPWALTLCQKLGIQSRIRSTKSDNRKVFVAKRGKLIPLPEGFYLIAPTDMGALASTPLFSLPGKLRMASEIFVAKRADGGDESVASFIRRRFGREALERVGQPMVAGIHSGDPERLSLSSTMPKFSELERRHGSVIRGLLKSSSENKVSSDTRGPRYSLFLSFDAGMQTLTDALAKSFPAGVLRPDSPVSLGKHGDGRWTVARAGEAPEIFDAVCLALGAKRASSLLRPVDAALADELGRLRFESVATLNFAFKRPQISHPMDGFGLVVPAVEKRSFIACTFASQKFEGRAPEGHVLVRAFAGGAYGKEFFGREDGDLRDAVLADLQALLGISGRPVIERLARYPESLPQYEVGHDAWLSRVGQALSKHAGLFLTGSSYRGTGITACVHDAQLQADAIAAGL